MATCYDCAVVYPIVVESPPCQTYTRSGRYDLARVVRHGRRHWAACRRERYLTANME